MTTPLARPTTTAGISEARNRSRMERFATVPRMIIVIDGGIRIPVPEAAATIAADHGRRYPARVIGGIIVDPIAAASALTEPDRPENSMVDTTTLMPSPPGSQPTSIVTNRTS